LDLLRKPRLGAVFLRLNDNQNMTIKENFDPNELSKFSELAHRWLDWIGKIVPLDGKKVLDVGCGGGILADAMARQGANVLGIDLATKSLKVAELHALEAQTQGVLYREISAEKLAAEQPNSFDVVTCMEMLEHVPDPSLVVKACTDLVKPGGHVFFSTINRNAKAFLFAIVGAEYILNLLPKGTHEYAKLIKPSELAGFCQRSGLEHQKMCGLQYNPLTRHYWLSADTSVNYMIATRKN
jgi:2-polyprenyl-6-hydroxyphenyl methylase/3-demethylubiquinone-9 3-methyltransferase